MGKETFFQKGVQNLTINVNFQSIQQWAQNASPVDHAERSALLSTTEPHLHFEPEQDECVDGEDSGAGDQQAQDVEGGPGEVLVDGRSVVFVEAEQRQLGHLHLHHGWQQTDCILDLLPLLITRLCVINVHPGVKAREILVKALLLDYNLPHQSNGPSPTIILKLAFSEVI